MDVYLYVNNSLKIGLAVIKMSPHSNKLLNLHQQIKLLFK